jgi:hypothetical protein
VGFRGDGLDGPIAVGGSDYCWSDDPGSRFTSADAAEVVRIHNQWLKDQEPLVFRLIKAERKMTNLSDQCREAQNKLNRLKEELDDSIAEVDVLRKQVASELVHQG